MNDKKQADQSLTKSLNGSALVAGPVHLDRLGHYRIESVIGSGGMGTVYLAVDESMKRKCALKVLHPMMEISGTAGQRFAREAWIAGQLDHPNIIKVYGRGDIEGIKYIALELADGGSLSSHIQDLKASMAQGDNIQNAPRAEYIRSMLEKFVDLASALSHIHQKGIIHRDIKPLNILLSGPNKILKLTDFGIAHSGEMTKMTRAGDFIGTIRYMSPELLAAHRAKVDNRTDVYSLGLTLYEALTLSLPYDDTTEEKYITDVLAGHSIPARRFNNKIPKDLETVLMKAMHHDPDRRYQTAQDFADDLRRYLENRSVLARRPGPLLRSGHFIKRHRFASLVTIVILMLSLGKTLWDAHLRSTRLGLEKTISAFEFNDANSVSDQALAILKLGFSSKRFDSIQNLRLARALVSPKILVSEYVSRNGLSRIGCQWQGRDSKLSSSPDALEAIIRPSIKIGDLVTIQRDTYMPVSISGIMIPPEKLKSLPLGENKIDVILKTWIFNLDQVERKSRPEQAFGILWNLRIIDDNKGRRAVFGSTEKTWEEIWPELEASGLAVWSGEVSLSKSFQLVDELPANFPLAVRSETLDKTMKEILIFKDFSFGQDVEPLHLDFVVESNAGPLPAPLATVLEVVTTDNVLLGTKPFVVEQGTDFSGSWAFISNLIPPVAGPQRDARARWIEKIKSGEKIPIVVRFTASRDVAARQPGFNSYWDGQLVFEVKAGLEK
jgi:serine/threonine protein kinase